MGKVKQNPGKYILFGDNLASHFNINVVKSPNKVIFIFWLPPNATHLLQLLGVAIFSSLKNSWRWFAILYTRRLEVGSANGSVVWQEILSFFTETFNEYSGTNYEKKL